MKRKFEVQIATTAIIEIDDTVIGAVDDEWRESFYQLRTPEQIAIHLAFNKVVNRCDLSELDGFANLSNALVQVEVEDWQLHASNIREG